MRVDTSPPGGPVVTRKAGTHSTWGASTAGTPGVAGAFLPTLLWPRCPAHSTDAQDLNEEGPGGVLRRRGLNSAADRSGSRDWVVQPITVGGFPPMELRFSLVYLGIYYTVHPLNLRFSGPIACNDNPLYIHIYIYISPIFLHTNVSQRVVVCDPPNPPKQLGGCTSTSPTSRLKARSLASSTGAHGPRTHHDLGHRSERSVLQSRPRRGRKLARREGPTPRQPGDSGAWTRPVPGTVKWLSDSNCD